ncbi:MAG: hypothetical protein ACLPSW_27685 [Roseiarcus sp.]
MSNIPNDLDARYDRATTAEKLTAAGFPVAKKTLETLATRGGGPIFQKFGHKPLYRWGDALDWAQGKLSKPVRTTSELEAA